MHVDQKSCTKDPKISVKEVGPVGMVFWFSDLFLVGSGTVVGSGSDILTFNKIRAVQKMCQ